MDNPENAGPILQGPSQQSDEKFGVENTPNEPILDDDFDNLTEILDPGEESKDAFTKVTNLKSLENSLSNKSCSFFRSDSSVNSCNSTSCPSTVPNVKENFCKIKLQPIVRRVFLCPKCKFSCFNGKDAKYHIEKVHNKKKSFCNFNTPSDAEFATKHAGGAFYACNECLYQTSVASHLLSHLNVHKWLKETRAFQCKDSSTVSEKEPYFLLPQPSNAEIYGNAMADDPTPKIFRCECCMFSCKEYCTLVRHQTIHTNKVQTLADTVHPNPTIFKCSSQCGFDTDKLELFERHLEFHEENYQALFDQDMREPKFRCQFCGFPCEKEEHLILHEKVHLQCSQNLKTSEPKKKKFKSSTPAKKLAVVQHTDRNSESCQDLSVDSEPAKEKFQCGTCCFACTKEQDFLQHMNKHLKSSQTLLEVEEHSQNGFTCSICDVSFERKKDLVLHEKCHSALSEEYEQMQTEPQNFKCKKCQYSYNEKRYLELHRSIHNENFKCLFCGKGFRQQNRLKNHVQVCKSKNWN